MLVYLNNFPRENAKRGQEFKGSDELKAELEKRKIIGEGEATVKDESSDELKSENDELRKKVEILEKQLKESITLPKGKIPEGYEDGEET